LQRLKSIMEPISVVILAGGQSRRMGRDKAQISLGGASWLERTARLAHESAPAVCVVGRTRPENWPLEGTVFLEDAAPGLGPLGGLLAALRWASERNPSGGVLALACDMPALSAEAVRWIVDEAALRCPARGLAVVNGGRVEPLFSIYGVANLPLVEQRLSEQRLSLAGLIEDAEFEKVEVRADIAAQLRNVNTPQDLEDLQSLMASRSNV
jgi:molybdopterin-guanine dinucleotide biosynthesis protein A